MVKGGHQAIHQLHLGLILGLCGISGLEIATNTVAFATESFPFPTKISGEVANLQLVFIFALSKQKG